VVSRAIIAEIGRQSAWLLGPMGAIHVALQRTGTPWMRCPRRHVPIVPARLVHDVLGDLEHLQHRPVEVRYIADQTPDAQAVA
jgi:hypothetical protein